MDFNKLCRTCLQNDKDTSDIFTSYYSKKNVLYSEMLESCTTQRLFEGDGLPRRVCKNCIRQLKRAFTFNILCEQSFKTLTSYIDNKPTPSETIKGFISDVKNEEKNQTEINVNSNVFKVSTELKEEIKVEPLTEDNDSNCWEADVTDNNVLLELIKTKTENDIDEDPVKKKRGRKKKEYPNGIKPKSDSKLPHQCDVCGKVLSTRSNLQAHKISHTDLRPYACQQCPATFKGYSALFHHKNTHTKEFNYHCEYCSKQFTRRNNLVNHIKIHTGDKRYHCSLCLKSFIQAAQYSIHMKRHKGDKPFLCQECGKGFAIKSDLRVHQRIHNGEKPYSCQICPKTFATAGNLSIHVRFHKKDIRYRCETCDKGFISASAFNVHIKRHKGQRDYLCYCGKTFFTSSALKSHKVTHTGEKKYQCKICGRKFSQSSHLNRHFKRDHASPNIPLPSPQEYRVIIKEPLEPMNSDLSRDISVTNVKHDTLII